MGGNTFSATGVSPKWLKSRRRRKRKKQAGFAEPHSSSTIGWVLVGLVLLLGWGWGRVGVGLGFGWGWVGLVLGWGTKENLGPK